MHEKKIIIYLNVVLLMIVFLFTGCTKDPPVYSKPLPRSIKLPILKIKMTEIPTVYTVIGSVVSDARVQVSSRITGYIEKIYLYEGEKVKKNQLLVTLDEADVEGAIDQVKANVAKARSTLEDAETDLKHYNTLFKKGIISDIKLRKISLQRDVLKNSLNEALAALKTSISQRNYTRILSPVEGVVVDRHKRNGDLALPGVPILTVESEQGLLFETNIPESCLKYIKVGDSIPVKIDALKKYLQGIIIRAVPSGDPVTRRFQVKISLPEQEGLLPGMFGRAKINIGREKILAINKSALVSRGGLEGIFILDQDNSVCFRWLRIGRQWHNLLEVTAGVKEGERFVALANPQLKEDDIIVQ